MEAYKYAEFLYNRMTTAGTGEFTPHELVYEQRPRFDRVKVFGCDMHEHLDGLPKVHGGTKARKGLFLGIPSDSPSGYLMYDINAGVVRTVFSATFDESFVRRSCGIRVYVLSTVRSVVGKRWGPSTWCHQSWCLGSRMIR